MEKQPKYKEINESTHCELCAREVRKLTRHHLIPKTRHKNKKNKKNFTREEVKERILWLCRPCHSNIHAVLSEKELEYDYNTLESLSSHPDIKKFTTWVHKRPDGTSVVVRQSRKRRK